MALDQSHNDTFTASLSSRLTLSKETNWIESTHDDDRNFKNNLEAFHDIEIILNDTFQITKHAVEDELPVFECAQEIQNLSAQDLIVREALEDILQQTFQTDSSRLQPCSANSAEDDDDNEIRGVRRCSSLKTVKTPPGTPGCKKIVRFADVLGLDLADVRTYLDDIPKVPISAYKALSNCHLEPVCPTTRSLLALFQQPVTFENFLEKVTLNMIAVENAYVDDPVSFCIKGAIRVRNLAFHKSVRVRYTMDRWQKSNEVQASYVQGSSDGFTDRFEFTLFAHALDIGEKLEFAARYQVNDEEYWDNNNRRNYCFQCLPMALPQSDPMAPAIKEQFATFYYDDQRLQEQDRNDKMEGPQPEGVFQNVTRGVELSSADVQEYIARSLGKNRNKIADLACVQSRSKPEVLLFFVIVFVSIIALYVKKIMFY